MGGACSRKTGLHADGEFVARARVLGAPRPYRRAARVRPLLHLADLAAEIRSIRTRRKELERELSRCEWRRRWCSCRLGLVLLATCGGRLFPRASDSLRVTRQSLCEQQAALRADIEAERLEIDTELSEDAARLFDTVRTLFHAASMSARVWDVTSEEHYDRRVTRSYAARSVTRQPTSILSTTNDEIPVAGGLLCFRNRNGRDLFLSPAFLAVQKKRGQVDLIDLTEISVIYSDVRFVESGEVPVDAVTIGYAWEKSNKDGSQDRRFAQNRQFPVVVYGELLLTSPTGLRECFQFSNADAARFMVGALSTYLKHVRRDASTPIGETPQGDPRVLGRGLDGPRLAQRDPLLFNEASAYVEHVRRNPTTPTGDAHHGDPRVPGRGLDAPRLAPRDPLLFNEPSADVEHVRRDPSTPTGDALRGDPRVPGRGLDAPRLAQRIPLPGNDQSRP